MKDLARRVVAFVVAGDSRDPGVSMEYATMAQPILKSPAEIDVMREAGRLVAQCHKLIREIVAPGVTTGEIDEAVESLIRKGGAVPAFKGYPSPHFGVKSFPASICASVNEEVVHGIPGDRILAAGDIISIDVGAELNGFFGDSAWTYAVGEISRKARRLLTVTEESLRRAIAVMKPGIQVRDISAAVQGYAESEGCGVVQDFVGHGIGSRMHEPPQVPNYVARAFGQDARVKLVAGTVLAVEPMLNAGKAAVRVKKDGWAVVTKDRSLSAHFEHTIAITESGSRILTEL